MSGTVSRIVSFDARASEVPPVQDQYSVAMKSASSSLPPPPPGGPNLVRVDSLSRTDSSDNTKQHWCVSACMKLVAPGSWEPGSSAEKEHRGWLSTSVCASALCLKKKIALCHTVSISELFAMMPSRPSADATEFYGCKLDLAAFQRGPKSENVRINLTILNEADGVSDQQPRSVHPSTTIAVFKYRLHRHPPKGHLVPPPELLTVTFAGVELGDDESFRDNDIEDDATLTVKWEAKPFEIKIFAPRYRYTPPKSESRRS